MMDNPADSLSLTSESCPGTLCYQEAILSVRVHDKVAFFFYTEAQSAGAIGKAQGEAWLKALVSIQDEPLQCLQIHVNSAGAHFKEPLEGLFYLNSILEVLWQVRFRGIAIRVVSTGWLYGGMAMALTTVANEIILGTETTMGLLGKRVSGCQLKTEIPVASFRPEHLELIRSSSL